MKIKDLITSRVCGNTVFENSWIWYCDECRQHGTAISSDEADFMAGAHYTYHGYTMQNEELAPDMNSDEYDTFIENNLLNFMDADESEREIYSFDNDMCNLFIIDEGNNVTYDYGDDYEDKTPNNVTDIQTMIKLQRELGLE